MAAVLQHRPLTRALAELETALQGVDDAMAFEADPAVLGDAACEIVAIQAKTDAVRIKLMRQADAAGTPATEGLRTMGQYVAAKTTHAAKNTNRDLRLSKWLAGFSEFADAFDSGTLTVDHVEYIRTKLDSPRSHFELRDAQQMLVGFAETLDFKGFKTAGKYWLIHIDPDGKEPREQLEKTNLSITTGVGDRFKLVLETDVITGDAITTAIEHRAKQIRAQDNNDGIHRTFGQRRAAAAAELIATGFAREDGTFPIPLFNMVQSQKVAEWAIDAIQNPETAGDFVPVHPTDVDGRCELINGTPVHPLLAAAVTGLWRLDKLALRRFVLNAQGLVLDQSVIARTAPEHIRTASHIEHRGRCSVPGCDFG